MRPTIIETPGMTIPGEFVSLSKPGEFVAAARAITPDTLSVLGQPVTLEQLYRVHDRKHVDGVLEGIYENGFHNRDTKVKDQVLAANSCMITAVEYALAHQQTVCAPVSGFHHAGWDYCSGYCTFNGIMVALASALNSGGLSCGNRVLIYDGDAHYGDGCVDIIQRGHAPGVDYMGRNAGIHPETVVAQIMALPFENYDLIIYQAGADAWIEDPLGAGYLTANELYARDATIFNLCADLMIPCVWNLAGGYHANSMTLHLATWRAYVESCNRLPVHANPTH